MQKSYLTMLQPVVIWVTTAMLLLTGAWTIFLFVRQGLLVLTFPYPLDYGEGPLLDQAARLADFHNIYPADLSEPPYAVSNYPPFFILLQTPLVWLFGPELWYGRAISLAATIIVAVLIILTLRTLTRDDIASVLGGLLFLAVPYVLRWSYLSRVDMLGLALSWLGIYLVVRKPGSRRSVILAAFLMVAAIYTRQTYALAAPLAAFVWLLSQRKQRQALALAVTVGGTSLGLLAMLSALTDGGFFLHTVLANTNEFRWEQVAGYSRWSLNLVPLMLAGAAAFLFLGLRSREASWWLVSSYLVGALMTACLIGKVGANVNYLLELSAALALATGALLGRYARHSGVRSVVLLAAAVQVVIVVPTLQSHYADLQADFISQRDGIERLEEIVDTSEKPVLADAHMGLLPLDGRRIYIQPFEFSQLSREGKWNQRPFVRTIRREKFEAILLFGPPSLTRDRWTSSMLKAIHSNYKRTENIIGTRVYRPRQTEVQVNRMSNAES